MWYKREAVAVPAVPTTAVPTTAVVGITVVGTAVVRTAVCTRYKNIAGRFFGLVTKHACDRQTQTDGQTDRITTPKTALA